MARRFVAQDRRIRTCVTTALPRNGKSKVSRAMVGAQPLSTLLLFVAMAGWFAPSAAATPSPQTTSCSWESIAAKYYGLNPYLLHAIAVQESGLNPLARSRPNTNGSVDIGLMQINSSWLPTLRSRFGIHRSHLDHPCINLDVGAWILYENFRAMGYTWRAIGAYNAVSDDKRLTYARHIYRRMPPALVQ
jgi:soluble lytic murein transglycosylase-like protein